jgi:hypothetical protein
MAKIKFRRDTAANWTLANPILAQGEPGFEHDTGLLKIGDGETVWTGLDYASGSGGDSLTDDKAVTVTVGNTEYFAIVNRANNNDDGVESSAVAYDSDNNLITLHISNVNAATDEDADDKLIISKFDSAATLLWQKQIEQEADPSTAHDVVIDADDNIIVVFNQDDAVGLGDYVNIIKFDSDGTELWKKLYSSSILSDTINTDFSFIDNTVGSGTFEGNAVQVISVNFDRVLTSTSTWVLEETTSTVWTTTATLVGSEYDGFLDRTYYYVSAEDPAVVLDSPNKSYRLRTQAVNTFMEASGAVTDGTHTYVTGAWSENESEEVNETTFILKVSNTDGSVAWAQSIRFNEGTPDEAYGMEIDTAGNLILVGVSYSPAGPNAAYVSKYSGVDGAHLWSRVVLDFNNDISYSGGDITVDSQNNIVVSINANQEIESENAPYATIAYVVKLNSTGTIQWARRAGPGPCATVATGIDSDSVGNVYLSALTTSQKNPVRDSAEFNDAKDVLAIAKYSTAGAVLWQRYIEADGYIFVQSTDQGDEDIGEFADNRNSGRNLSLSSDGKIAVQVTVKKRDLDDNRYDSNYWESITFQIDQDGREMTIGSGDEKFAVKASRIPGKFVTLPEVLEGEAYSPEITDLVPDLDVTTATITYADAELAQHIMKSAPYEYVFGNDGTLTIPNDGDVKLTQTQIGWFSIFGPANNDNDDIWIRANCVDPDTGDVYVVGVDRDSGQGFVARYNSQGEILWSIRLVDDDNNNNTRCNAVKLHPSNGNLVVLAEYYGNETGALLLQIDPDTAQVVNDLGFRDLGENSGVEAYDFDFFTNDDVVVVGRKYDEWTSIPVTAQTGSTTSTLYVLNSELPAGLNTSWYVGGTGITGRTSIDNINFYTPLTGTTQQGSGAVFDIINNGNGTYSVGIVNSGTNYLVGHKIKILGTSLTGAETAVTYTAGVDYPTLSVKRGTDSIVVSSTLTSIIALLDTGTVLTNIDNLGETLTITGPGVENEGNLVYPTTGTVTVSPGTEIGQFTLGAGTYGTGATPDNDIIITVDAVEAGIITSVSNSGTAAGTFTATASGVSGTNYLVGSGADFYIEYNSAGALSNYGIWNEVGQNYVVGDVITIAGTAFAGGATPTNDATITVTTVGEAGDLQNPITVGGTFPTTQTRITTGGSIDFGGVGSWSLEVPLGGEGFVWTANWNKTVGSTNYDANERYYSVAVGSDNSIYAVGEIYPNGSTSYFKAVVSKFNSTGTHQWSRALNVDTFGASAKSVAVRGTTVAVSSYDNAVGTVITKLDTSGNIKWQRRTDSGDDSSVAIDTNGDIYAVIEANLENKYESIIKAIRFASNGEPIWRKFFGTLTSEYGGTNEYFKNGRNITLDAEHFYVSGYTTAFADDYESGFLVKLPKAGDCDGYYGGWTVQTEAYDIDKVIGSQAGTFTPEVSTGEFETWEPVFTTDWYDPSDDDYYQTLQPIVDRDGGAIEFGDGTRQTSSAQQIPQRAISNGADHRLCLDDMGKHIYVTNSDTRIHVPYHQDNPLPIGFTVVIINNSGSTISIDADGGSLDIVVPGVSTSQYWDLDSPGMATLIKVTEYTWFMTGNVQVD